jgi:hypothetical protein
LRRHWSCAASQRLGLPDHLFAADTSEFEQEVNQLRTHQGQSDVFVINDKGTILAPTFGGSANSLVTEVLGGAAIFPMGERACRRPAQTRRTPCQRASVGVPESAVSGQSGVTLRPSMDRYAWREALVRASP